ncbi:CpsD/CapB family tyrosine-protein kinase [Isoptericola halotolerans]|uniref:polysaccharide biosynthesis tyrosine autokinase n=1 Tax=Isoptericola halotolerans TaxID=300560 RepID=UPI00388DA27C
MTIREFVRTVWSAKYLVLTSIVVVVAASLFYLDRQVTMYSATAEVRLLGVQTAQGGEELVEVTVDTTNDDVTAEPVLEAAAQELGDESASDLTAVVSSGGSEEDGSLVTVSAETSDPERSEAIANAVAAAYVDYVPELQEQQLATLDERRDVLADQLEDVTRQLERDADDPLALAEQETIVGEYTSLTERVNTLGSIAEPAELVAPADGATELGVSPAVVVAVAVLVGLVAGVGVAFGKRGLDVRVRTTAEAARLAESPVLAELYAVRDSRRDFAHTHVLPVSSKVATPFTESIRELRTSVQVSLDTSSSVIIAVTAADPHAPRSFITANLAASFALSGRRTIAVSADLRRPQLDRMLPFPDGWHGGRTGVRGTNVPNLGVLTITEDAMDPADFLATARATALIGGLRERAEVIVIDAPPVLAAADATILGRYADGVVLIASAGRTDAAVLKEAAERLRTTNVKLSGIALEGVKSDRRMLYASTYGEDDGGGESRLRSLVRRSEAPPPENLDVAAAEPVADRSGRAQAVPVWDAIPASRDASGASPPELSADTRGPGPVRREPAPVDGRRPPASR